MARIEVTDADREYVARTRAAQGLSTHVDPDVLAAAAAILATSREQVADAQAA